MDATFHLKGNILESISEVLLGRTQNDPVEKWKKTSWKSYSQTSEYKRTPTKQSSPLMVGVHFREVENYQSSFNG